MSFPIRSVRLCFSLLASLALSLAVSSCGNSDHSPTSPGAATLSGTVISGTSAAGMRTQGMQIGLGGVTVRVTSTGKSTQTDGSGNFSLTGVPSGSVELALERADINARATVTVVPGAANKVTISVVGSRGVVVPGGHSGEEIEGLVSANDGSTLTVLDQRLGAVIVHTDGNTVVRTDSTTIPLSQIAVGNRVHVKAVLQDDQSYLATEILLQNEKVGGNREVSGSVMSVDSGAKSFVVQSTGANVTVTTDSSTMFKRRGGSASFSDVVAGATVQVVGTLQGDGTVLAKKVTIES
ncbi:MAG TPA: DUF5666 domain-containing protein [Thermoanaerobaculia bacterium]|nr:DUF5666 domain-containing protein [Thermoanaerobaculia bacterium]